MANWNLWHGCRKKSEGCAECYVRRSDERYGRDPSRIYKTSEFDLPVRRTRSGDYAIKSGEHVWTCFSSDFLLEDADEWRTDAWAMMRERQDLTFLFITKRPERFLLAAPPDWEENFRHVTVCVTAENQLRADERLPIYLELPLRKRIICCAPLLGHMDIRRYIGPWIDQVTVGGESGPNARVCDYSWVLSLRDQCADAGCGFYFQQTGARLRKDGRIFSIPRKEQHRQAARAGISTVPFYAG